MIIISYDFWTRFTPLVGAELKMQLEIGIYLQEGVRGFNVRLMLIFEKVFKWKLVNIHAEAKIYQQKKNFLQENETFTTCQVAFL